MRLPSWPDELNAFVERRRRMPFKWGVHDCCQFARRGVEAQRGTDPATALNLRKYRRSSGAAAMLRRLGGIDAVPGACGLVEVPIVQAQRGDVMSHAFESRLALGLCMGEKSVFPGKRGLVFVPTLECRRAWKV